MLQSNKLCGHIHTIVGKKLDDLNLACEMMMFSFGEFELHAQCMTRILKEHDILTTTLDYQSWDEVCDKNNDEWYFVSQFKNQIVGGTVVSVEISNVNDVAIILDNGIQIQILITNGYHHYREEQEQWVFFKHNDHSYPFITVYNRSVDIVAEW